MWQGISDRVPLVKAVVPKNQSHSFITQGSPDTMVRRRLLHRSPSQEDYFLIFLTFAIVR